MKKLTLTFVLFTIIFLTNAQLVNLNIKVYLEGPFNGIDMNTNLNSAGLIPLIQPYNTAPWDYEGTESVPGIPNGDVVDWVLVELRETTGGASTALSASVIAKQACLLLKNGQIVKLDGVSLPEFNLIILENLYVVIWFRNHLALMSATPLTESTGTYNYDFTDEITKAYGDGQKALGGGIYGMIGGDSDANGIIDMDDRDINWINEAGNAGYYGSDLNMDSQVNNPDKNDMWEENYGIVTAIATPCGFTIYDERDGKYYNTVQIGTQCWMAENLNVGIRIDGIVGQTDNDTIEKFCYNNIEDSCEVYGGLYQWGEAMKYREEVLVGICPEGWHIPTDEEWKQLEGEVDSQYGYPDPEWDATGTRGFDAGLNLKATSGWNAGANGSGIFSFNALPAGYRTTDSYFHNYPFRTGYWYNNSLQVRLLVDDSAILRQGPGNFYETAGFSIRCLRIDTNILHTQPFDPIPVNGGTGAGIETLLSWTCYDIYGDDLLYKIHFGTDEDPPFIAEGLTETFYDPGTLNNVTTYYWKVIAFDSFGDSTVSDVWSFTTIGLVQPCPGLPSFTYGGQIYTTIQIGTQCWMAENLNIGTMINGVSDQIDNDTIEKYCYNNIEDSCGVYGGLYQWDETMQYIVTQGTQGICPTGWHIPTDEEWKQLQGEVDSQYGYPDPEWNNTGYKGFDVGLNLKSTSGWSEGLNGTDTFGFTALPSGQRNYYDWAFIQNGINSTFWTSNNYSTAAANMRDLKSSGSYPDKIYQYISRKKSGLALRCLRD